MSFTDIVKQYEKWKKFKDNPLNNEYKRELRDIEYDLDRMVYVYLDEIVRTSIRDMKFSFSTGEAYLNG